MILKWTNLNNKLTFPIEEYFEGVQNTFIIIMI